MKASEALAIYGRRVGPVNREQNIAIVRRWLMWGGQPTDAHLAAYAKHLLDEGLRSGTVDLHLRTVRAFYRHLGIHAPRNTFQHDQASERRPAAGGDLVRALIGAAKAGEFSAHQVAYLALGSVYGMRVGEVSAVRQEDVDLDGGRIFVRTEKGGVRRWQRIPDEIAPYLAIDWDPQDPDVVNASFGAMLASIGVKREKGDRLGMHILRRGVVLGLRRAGVADEDIAVFMRWARGGKGVQNATGGVGEVLRYSDPSAIVGVGGEEDMRQLTAEQDPDAAAWARHPFLAMWA